MILMAYYKAKEMIEFQITYTANLTARPQTVARNINKAWCDLIKTFNDLRGERLIMNVFLNLSGRPLFETPKGVIKSFAVSGFDIIYM